MKRNTDINRRPRRLLGAVLALAAAGLAAVVIAISTTGGGSNTASSSAAREGPTPAAHIAKTHGRSTRMVKVANAPAATGKKSSLPKAAAKASSAIPQNNGGDSDPDNNGGPSDGDGNI
jgi:hypothetical protein